LLGVVLLLILPGTLISNFGFMGLTTGMVLAVVIIAPAFVAIFVVGGVTVLMSLLAGLLALHKGRHPIV
jgi:hypothetical protein